MGGVTKISDQELTRVLLNELLETWQPIAAISKRIGVNNKKTYSLLENLRQRGIVFHTMVRFDGHNAVHCYKLAKKYNAMGVVIVVNTDGDELVSEDG